MKTYKIRLQINSGTLTPFHADTLFGHLCWVVAHQKGDTGVKKFLEPFKNGDPPFILSDGFPGDFLPKPLSIEISVDDPDERKELRKSDLISRDEFVLLQKGGLFKHRTKDMPIKTSLTIHNTVSRLSNTTLLEGGLYNLEETYITPGYHITIYIKAKSGEVNRVEELFKELSNAGYGRKKSIGKGQFIVAGGIEDFKGFDEERKNANGFVTLSNFCPDTNDPVEGLYKIMIKYGKLGEEFTFCGNPFKRPLVMIKTGSVFRTSGKPKDFYGRMVSKVSLSKEEVVHYGFSFAVPMKYIEAEIKTSKGIFNE